MARYYDQQSPPGFSNSDRIQPASYGPVRPGLTHPNLATGTTGGGDPRERPDRITFAAPGYSHLLSEMQFPSAPQGQGFGTPENTNFQPFGTASIGGMDGPPNPMGLSGDLVGFEGALEGGFSTADAPNSAEGTGEAVGASDAAASAAAEAAVGGYGESESGGGGSGANADD